MGYRSDVCYVFYTRKPEVVSFPMLKLWFDENFPKHDFCTVVEGDDYIKVSYESVKWYESYPEVQAAGEAVESFTNTFEANEKDNVAWEGVIVGEELNDTSHDGSAYVDYRLYVNRSISFI